MKTLIMMGLVSTFSGGTAMAGVSTFVGEGHVSHPAEYIEVSVTIQSMCFADVNDARNATNDAAKKVLDLMRGKLDSANPKDAAYTSGGSTTRHTISNQINQFCVGKFGKSTNVTLLTSSVSDFEKTFEDLENLVYSDALNMPTRGIDAPVTYATIQTPIARIYSETIIKLEREALIGAIENAKFEFQVMVDHSCGVSSFQITKTEEPGIQRDVFSNPYAGTRGTPRRGSNSAAPVSFADIWVSKGLNVEFTFEGGRCDVVPPADIIN